MGDIIHTLPALADAYKFVPNLKITWVIEDAFQEIAYWHPAVERVIPISLRKFNLQKMLRSLKDIRAQEYDLIIDGQGLLKSAVIARLARAKKIVGFDKHSSRESIASWFYQKTYPASKMSHAVDRLRQLFAQTFAYQIPNNIDYGVQWNNIIQVEPNIKPYLVFLHGTTWESKHWPDEYWFALADLVAQHDLQVQVTWATPEQKARAEALASRCANVKMLPHLTLKQAANVLYNASGVVAVDTGFAHLSAALAKPMVAIYGSTDIQRNGTVGKNNINIGSKFKCAPCTRRICDYKGDRAVNPPCLQEITPQLVWHNLSAMISNTR